MKAVDSFTDQGVIRSSSRGNGGHCQAMVTKATKMAGAIRRVFRDRRRELLWVAFQCYILNTLCIVLRYGVPTCSVTLIS